MEEKGTVARAMATESTPLIQTVPVVERPARYPHSNLRRVCTVLLVIVPLLTLVGVYIYSANTDSGARFNDISQYSVFESTLDTTTPHASWPQSEGIEYDQLKQILLETPDAQKAREWSQYYTAGPHLAGKNKSQAEWTRDKWLDFGVDSAHLAEYEVYLNYPVDHHLALLEHGKETFVASLEEDVLDADPTSQLEERIPTFHGYSASGNVTGQIVYCNYGTYADFEDLQKANISLVGKIALVKYGGIFRGLKVKRASDLGMIGVVIYSDPGDDGEITEVNGYQAYPDGPARQPSSVQRGSVQYLSIAPGDPTTIGYPSKPGVPRQSIDGKLPDIPSLPISYKDALPLLRALNGHGPPVSDFPNSWQNGGLGHKGVKYDIGPSPKSTQLNLLNLQEYIYTPIWNAIGIINGTLSDEVIIIGNHRDAWIAGGAADPNSGSAALNEIVRSFGKALAAGWRPQRTIVFASWDAEEYGLVGSTEWVEEYLPWLSDATIAYLNVDVGARGPRLRISAAPVLHSAIIDALGEVQSPNQTVPGQTTRDVWSGRISTIGSGSDFTAFNDFAGISSMDIGFDSGHTDPVYHYHSNYDSFAWMDRFGDRGFQYHITIAKILAVLTAKLVEAPIVHLNATDYAVGLKKYLQSVKDLVPSSGIEANSIAQAFVRLDHAVADFRNASAEFESQVASVSMDLTYRSAGVSRSMSEHFRKVREINDKYKNLERKFLYQTGLDGRNWFKHVIFAPGKWTGYAGATFPGLVEALEDDDETSLHRWAEIISSRIHAAAEFLRT